MDERAKSDMRSVPISELSGRLLAWATARADPLYCDLIWDRDDSLGTLVSVGTKDRSRHKKVCIEAQMAFLAKKKARRSGFSFYDPTSCRSQVGKLKYRSRISVGGDPKAWEASVIMSGPPVSFVGPSVEEAICRAAIYVVSNGQLEVNVPDDFLLPFPPMGLIR